MALDVIFSRWRYPDGSVAVEGWRAWAGAHYLDPYYTRREIAEVALTVHDREHCPQCVDAAIKASRIDARRTGGDA